jgi:hypothetical protein
MLTYALTYAHVCSYIYGGEYRARYVAFVWQLVYFRADASDSLALSLLTLSLPPSLPPSLSLCSSEPMLLTRLNAHVCSRMLTYAHVCSRMLTYAHVRPPSLPLCSSERKLLTTLTGYVPAKEMEGEVTAVAGGLQLPYCGADNCAPANKQDEERAAAQRVAKRLAEK